MRHIQEKPYNFVEDVKQGKDDLLKYLGDIFVKDTGEKLESKKYINNTVRC